MAFLVFWLSLSAIISQNSTFSGQFRMNLISIYTAEPQFNAPFHEDKGSQKDTNFNADIKACNFPIGLLSLFLKKGKKMRMLILSTLSENFSGSLTMSTFFTPCVETSKGIHLTNSNVAAQ